MKNSDKIILDLCGGTAAWSRPYREAGYDVRLVTLPERDVRIWETYREILDPVQEGRIYGILAAPPCTMFSLARTNAKTDRDFERAMEVVEGCLRCIWEAQYKQVSRTAKHTRLKFWALENPNGMLKYFLGKPAFEFSPYEFGDGYKKRTCLWGHFNEPITKRIKNPFALYGEIKDIHPEKFGELTRTERRAITPTGFANAFFKANQ